jgi:hypothetical protein
MNCLFFSAYEEVNIPVNYTDKFFKIKFYTSYFEVSYKMRNATFEFHQMRNYNVCGHFVRYAAGAYP